MVKLFVCGDFRAKNASVVHIDEELKNILSGADYAICNFEAPVVSKGKPIKKSGPTLDQDVKAPNLLKDLGFNVILMANNHIMDYGEEGCQATLNAFSDCICVGAGKAQDSFEVKVVEKDGKKLGFLSFVQHEFGVVESKADERTFGAAWINSYDIEDIIIEAKSSVDFLLVFPHAGIEHIDAPLPEWRRCYKKMIEWGADMVLASHPHCPQGWEIYNNKYIFYSLGNFYFDELKGGKQWFKSLGIEILIENSITFKTHNLLFDKSGSIGIDESIAAINHVDYLNKLLSNEKLYTDYIDNTCSSQYNDIKYGLMRSVCAFTFHIKVYYAIRLLILMLLGKRNEMYLLNYFQNESHRWLCERYLRNINK